MGLMENENGQAASKKTDWLFYVLVGIGFIGGAAMVYYVSNAGYNFRPAVMTGEEGLNQMYRFLGILLSVQLLLLIGLPAFLVLLGTIYLRVNNQEIKPFPILVLAGIGLALSLTAVPLRLTGVEIQAGKIIVSTESKTNQILLLRDAVKRDLDEQPITVIEDRIVLAESRTFTERGSTRGHTGTARITEYYLEDEKGIPICQISAEEYEALKPCLCELSGHTIRCYPNSGMLYDIDGGAELATEEELVESIYTIRYDDDGYIRWDGPANGVELENLSMRYYIDGELRLDRSMKDQTMDNPLVLDGHDNEIYMNAIYHGEYTRVSNILKVTAQKGENTSPALTTQETVKDEIPSQDTPGMPVVTVPIPEIEAERYIGTDYLVNSWGLLIVDDNPYYEEVMKGIDAVAGMPGITLGSEFKTWYPVDGLRHGTKDIVFLIYMNTDMQLYQVPPQSEADMYYRVKGVIEGRDIDIIVPYETELHDLLEAERLAKQAQIRRQSKNNNELDAYVYYVNSANMVTFSCDGCGRFVLQTNSDTSELYNMAGRDQTVHIYDIRPTTKEEYEGDPTHPDIVGKVEISK